MRNYNLEQIILKQKDNNICFYIDSCLGSGGSCIAYKVTYEESDGIKHSSVLKEYCPAYLEEYGQVRNDDGSLIIPSELSAQFAAELEKFRQIYVSINDYLVNNPQAANFHPVQLGIYEGNNTLYTLVSCDYGKSYDKIKDNSLKSVLNLMLSAAKGVELYHNAGFLHLDIKPENIFILNEVTELVKLFDYDSLTSMEDLKSMNVRAVPCPGVYYVPELNQRNLRAINKSTDIFEIGAMLFLRLFGRSPETKDMSYDSVYDFTGAALLTGVSPMALFELETIFRHTIQISARNRYQSTVELKQQLEKLISLVDSKDPYLLNMPKWQPSKDYISRKTEIAEIHIRLYRDGYVFVKGIGGLGKSELAKIYAKEFSEEYHTVVFCKFTDSLEDLIASLPIHGINTDDYTDFDKLVKDKNLVLRRCDAHTLIIVDNFNVTYDKYLRDFLPASPDGLKVIFTTRCTQAAEYYVDKTYEIPKLSQENCSRLFIQRSGLSLDGDDEALQKLITDVDSNTLILALLASAVKRTSMTINEVRRKLDEQKLNDIRTELFHEFDYDTGETKAYNKLLAHLYAVFSISGLSEGETEVLKDMTLVDADGISIDKFIDFCNSPSVSEDVVMGLANQSWLFFDNADFVSMHPTVSDLMANNSKLQKKQSYINLAEALENYCNPDYVNHISVVLSRLSTAVQLDRRYKTERLDKRIMMRAKLGRLYANIYRPVEARKHLIESEKMTVGTKYEYFLPYIYYFLGEFEKYFGTQTAAISYYEYSIKYSKKPTIRYYWIAAESMIAIGQCYIDNKQYREAYNQFLDTFRYVRFHRLTDQIIEIAKSMIEVCQELELTDKEEKYQNIFNKYKAGSEYDLKEFVILDSITSSAKAGNIVEMMQNFDSYLNRKREELGEDSPFYKDIAKNMWVKYILNGDKETAMRSVSETLDYIKETYGADSMEMAEHLALVASTFPLFSEFTYSESAAERALQICKQLKQESSYTCFEAKLAIAKSYLLQNRLTEAQEILQDVDLRVFSGNEALSDIINSAGIIFCELSLYNKAEDICTEFLQRNNTDITTQINANTILSVVNEQCGNLNKAEHYVQISGELINGIKEKENAKRLYMFYYRAAARLASRRGDNRKATNLLNELLDFYTEEEQTSFLFHVVFNEMGLYYSYLSNTKEAKKAYEKSEQILKINNMPKDAYLGLYNNIASQLESINQFMDAKVYLNKIVAIKPEILKPKTAFDAIVCGNIAWTAFNLDNVDYAIEVAEKGLRCEMKLGAEHTRECIISKSNLAGMYVKKEQFDKAIQLFKKVIDEFENDPNISDPKTRVAAGKWLIYSLIKTGCAEEGYYMAKKEAAYYSELFSEDDLAYADAISGIGTVFEGNRYYDCMEFYDMALERLTQEGHEKTLMYAKLIDYIGVYLIDLKDNSDEAMKYFIKSKSLFEELGATDDELYPVVIQNIEYAKKVKEEKFDKIISDLANVIKKTGNNQT
jgi:tetratricopeptide (TPR) repeat protein/serine/threonine protein kinase